MTVLFGVNFNMIETQFPQGSIEGTRLPESEKPKQQTSTANSNGQPARDTVDLSESARQARDSLKVESQLSEKERKELEELKRADRAVRAHEQAHKAVGGQYVRGGANYEYTRGPDGQLYAVGGEVKIDVSEVEGDPEATIRKMELIRRAALAPQDPSAQDRRVAAEASRRENRARVELQRESTEEINERISDPEKKEEPGREVPGEDSAVFQIKDAKSYQIDPPENLFELFA